MSDGGGHGIGTRTLRGMAWSYGAYVGGRLLVLVSTAILARVLTPEDFGVVALAMTFMVFLDAVKDLGLGKAVIVSSDENVEDRSQTAFCWSVLIGVALTGVTAAGAPLAASFFHEDDLTGLLPLLGATFLIRALGATHYALARKALDYRVRTVSEIVEVTVRGVVGIVLALLDFGAWALVIGFVAGAVANTIVLWAMVSWRPSRRFSSAHLRSMLTFGGLLTIVDIGAVLAYNLDYLFIGRVLGASALGFYSIAFRLPELVVLNLANVAGDVLFPAYAAVDKARLREAYLTTLRYITLLTMPITVGLLVLAGPVIRVVFGDQWGESVAVMQILCVYAFVTTMAIPSGTVYKVTNRAWINVAFTVPGLAILVLLLLLFADEGIVAVALCTAAMPVLFLPISITVASRQMRVSPLAIFGALAPSVVCGAAMAAATWPLERAISAPLPALLVAGAAGTAAYALALFLVARDDVRRLREMAMPRRVAAA